MNKSQAIMYSQIMKLLIALEEPISINAIAALLDVSTNDVNQFCVTIQSLLIGFTHNDNTSPIDLAGKKLHKRHLSNGLSPPLNLKYFGGLQEHDAFLLGHMMRHIEDHLKVAEVPFLGYTEGDWDIFYAPDIPRILKGAVSESLWYSCHYLVAHALKIKEEHLKKKYTSIIRKLVFSLARPLLEFTASTGVVLDLDALEKWSPKIFSLPASPTSKDLKTARGLGQSLTAMIACLDHYMCRETPEINCLSRVCSRLYRRICKGTLHPEIMMEAAVAIRHEDECSCADYNFGCGTEGVGIAAKIVKADPTPANKGVLARCLRVTAQDLYRKRGVRMAEGAVSLYRRLASEDQSYTLDLIRSLLTWVHVLSRKRLDVGPMLNEALDLCRALVSDSQGSSPIPTRELAFALLKAGDLSRRIEIDPPCDYYHESSEVVRNLNATWPSPKHAGWHLHVLKETATEMEANSEASYVRGIITSGEALPVYLESLNLVRELARTDPAVYRALALSNMVNYGSLLIKHQRFDEALPPLEECVTILSCQRDAGRLDLETESLLSDSLRLLSECFTAQGKWAEALSTALESKNAAERVLKHDDDLMYQRDLGKAYKQYALCLAASDQLETALIYSARAVAVYTSVILDEGSEWHPPPPSEKSDEDLLEELQLFHRLCVRRNNRKSRALLTTAPTTA
ncbi:hypothetical protein FA15DRAFT_657161 [Coprinopsis marcescibilis]|uniref:TPR-like protein n=1 Tax=Coprinopsis marcescibilis TaxID=230819 RepID=A0A5C3KRM1_COPMA|nr:hypothetical protein FA15DRAFT_657161 [Coprinopsis marcescibilis]